MSDELDKRYRLHLASFLDSERGALWKERISDRELRAAADFIRELFARDLGRPADELDGQAVEELLGQRAPARLGGAESYASAFPDLLEDWLVFLNEAEGLSLAWDWTRAVDAARAEFETAMRDDSRARVAPSKREPERRPGAKLGRNDPCPCGSGAKYKACCLRLL